MNHPRRRLLLVLLALLGAALLVRAPLPRPQTEGDKWLWEMAEAIPSLMVNFGPRGQVMQHQMGLNGGTSTWVMIKNRQGVRGVLRSFKGTPAFAPLPAARSLNARPLQEAAVIMIGSPSESFYLTREPQGYFLYRWQSRMVAPISQQEFARFREGLQPVVNKAKQRQSGYSVVTMPDYE